MSSQSIDFSKYEQKAPASIDFSQYEPKAVPKASFWDRFKDQPSAEDDALKRELSSAAQSIYGIPKSIIHAFTDEPTAEERDQFKGDVEGAKRIGLGIHRLTTAPLDVAAQWYGDVARGKVPNAYEQALSVAPEAIGSASGSVLAGKLAETAPATAKALANATAGAANTLKPLGALAKDLATNPDVVGAVSPRAAHVMRLAQQAGKLIDAAKEATSLDATGENKAYAGERAPGATPPTPGVEPPAPRIPAKQLPPIPGVNVPPNVGRLNPVIPTEPPAPANPDYVPFRPSIERIIDEVKNEPGFKNVSRADLDARFSKALAEVQQEAAQAPQAQPEDLAGKLQQTLDQIKARGKQMAPRVPKESLDDFNARLAKIADAKKAARSLEDLQ